MHMLEDVMGWIVVLVGAIVMKFTNFALIDPILSIAVALFILANALKSYKKIIDLFLMKIPDNISIVKVKNKLLSITGIRDVHHIHVWSMDGFNNYATMHVVATGNTHEIKEKIREELREHDIHHVTLEIEEDGELCNEIYCNTEAKSASGHHRHHYH